MTLVELYLVLVMMFIAIAVVIPGVVSFVIRRHQRHQFSRPAESVDLTRLLRQSHQARSRRRAWTTI